jgi:hypothetical protein
MVRTVSVLKRNRIDFSLSTIDSGWRTNMLQYRIGPTFVPQPRQRIKGILSTVESIRIWKRVWLPPFDPDKPVSVDEVLRLTYCLGQVFGIRKSILMEEIRLEQDKCPVITAYYSLFGDGIAEIQFRGWTAHSDTDLLARGSIYSSREEIQEDSRIAFSEVVNEARRLIRQGQVRGPKAWIFWFATRRFKVKGG